MNRKIRGYVRRFTLLHVVTYWVVGSIFYQLMGYDEALTTMETFELFRPLENLTMVGVVFGGQFLRGGILALLLYPFYNRFMAKRHGWLLVFGLLYGITMSGSAIFVPDSIGAVMNSLTWGDFIDLMKIGIPELTIQMILFSWLLVRWERKIGRCSANLDPGGLDYEY